MSRRRIAFVVSTPMTAKAFLSGHMAALAQHHDVELVAPTTDPDQLRHMGVDGATRSIAIVRKISPVADLKALIALHRLFRRERYDAVVSVTPKAGLLGMAAALAARVPSRTHWFTGQVWATRRGFGRAFLRAIDRLIFALTTHALVDSPSQRDFLLAEGVVSDAGSSVLAEGSICGVDSERFRPDEDARAAVRAELALAPDDVVFLFLGRLNREKGVLELARAFRSVSKRRPEIRLLIVGPDEEGMREAIGAVVGASNEKVRFVPFTDVPQRFMAACDVFCLPSHREGFGSVLVEAAATGAPVLASRIYGITDAVVEGESGLLHAPRDVEGLAAAMDRLAGDADLRARMGAAGRERALRVFPAARVTAEVVAYVDRQLGGRA